MQEEKTTLPEYAGEDTLAKQSRPTHDSRAMNKATRDRILLEQMPQVRYIARRIHDRLPQQVAIEDLVHAGVLGLIDALTKYDEARQVRFKTYAKFRIRGAILDSLRELDWSPRELRRKARQMATAAAEIGNAMGRSATGTEIAGQMGLTMEAFQRLLGELEALEQESSRPALGDGEREADLCEDLPGNPEENPCMVAMKSELSDLLGSAIATLRKKEQQVLSLYYYEELTMKETGAVLGIGESRVSQIHSLALLRLRARMRSLMGNRNFPPRCTSQLRDGTVKALDGGSQ